MGHEVVLLLELLPTRPPTHPTTHPSHRRRWKYYIPQQSLIRSYSNPKQKAKGIIQYRTKVSNEDFQHQKRTSIGRWPQNIKCQMSQQSLDGFSSILSNFFWFCFVLQTVQTSEVNIFSGSIFGGQRGRGGVFGSKFLLWG